MLISLQDTEPINTSFVEEQVMASGSVHLSKLIDYFSVLICPFIYVSSFQTTGQYQVYHHTLISGIRTASHIEIPVNYRDRNIQQHRIAKRNCRYPATKPDKVLAHSGRNKG